MEHHLLRQTYWRMEEGLSINVMSTKKKTKKLKKLDIVAQAISWHQYSTPVFLRGKIIVHIKMLLNGSFITCNFISWFYIYL